MEDDVAEKFCGTGIVLIEKCGMDHGFLLGCIRVQLTANVFHTAEHVIRLPVAGSFEDGVLHKMGKSVFLRQLIARTHIDEKAEVCHWRVHLTMNTTDAVRKRPTFEMLFLHGAQRY